VPPGRLLRVLRGVAEQLRQVPNPLAELAYRCLSCFVACSERWSKFANKFAYIDVCMSSSNFVPASWHASDLMAAQELTVLPLYGACGVVACGGVLWVAGATAALAYLAVALNGTWTSDTSLHFVSNPYFVSGTAAVLGGGVATCFVMLFDHAADTLLYMYAWNWRHSEGSIQRYAPDVLLSLVQYTPLAKQEPTVGPSVLAL